MFGGRSGHALEQIEKPVGHRSGPQRVLDELGNALFEAQARPYALRKRRPLVFDSLERIERLLDSRVEALRSGLLRHPDECPADQALQIVLALDHQLQSHVANGRAQQPGINRVQIGEFRKPDRDSATRGGIVVLNRGHIVFENQRGRFLVVLAAQFLDELPEVPRRNAPGVRRSQHGALTGFGHRRPELAIQNVQMGLHDESRAGHLFLVSAKDLAQPRNFLGHAVEHLTNGVYAHFAFFVAVQSEADGQMFGQAQQHWVIRFCGWHLRAEIHQRLPQQIPGAVGELLHLLLQGAARPES